MIYITGDTHGTIDIGKIRDLEAIVKEEDYIIVLGDFGFPQGNKDTNTYLYNFYGKLKCKVLFIDGNHEDFYRLSNYKEEEWHGGKVQFITKNVIHLMRGEIFEIDGLKFLACGGALSIDRQWRVPGVSWFPEEAITNDEFEHACENLRKHNNKVDYVLTHTPPYFIVNKVLSSGFSRFHDVSALYLAKLSDIVECKKWFSGHMHVNQYDIDDKYTLLYNDVVKLSEDA